jgi:signal transduction histidine kinase/ligand-binding sensor domain-containing protein
VRRVGVVLTTLLLYAAHAWPADADFTLQQLNHRTFTATERAPAPIYALAQTPDGTLWAGGSGGLTRFDGIHFVSYPGPADPSLPSGDITVLTSASNGALWIGYRVGGITLLRKGQLSNYGEREGLPAGTIKSLVLDHEGTLWIGTTSGLARLRGTHLETVAADLIPSVKDILLDRADTLWVATGEAVLARARGAAHFQVVSREPSLTARGKFHNLPMKFAESSKGQVWTVYGDRMRRVDTLSESQPHNQSFSIAEVSRNVLTDHDGNLWFANERDVKRWPLPQQLADQQSNATMVHAQTLGPLTGTPLVLLEDREHNIWVGTSGGLDRLSLTNVVRALPDCQDVGWALVAGDAGTLWAVCASPNSASGHLVEIRDGQIISQRETAGFTAAYRDPTGEIWFGGSTALGHLKDGVVETTPLPAALKGFDIQAIASDRSGALWISVVRKGIYRFLQGQWVAYDGVAAILHGPAIVATPDTDGSTWFGYPNNRIARSSADGAVHVFDTADGLNVGNVTAIQTSPGHVWVGGEVGFEGFDGTRFVPIRSASSPLKGISGIVGTRDGALWLNSIGGIAHIAAAELEHALREPGYAVHCAVLDSMDGVPGPPTQLRPLPTATATTDGRVWFDVIGGLIWIDARHWIHNALPPPVTIWSITSAGQEYPNLGMALHLPILTTRLQIDYTAGSLTIPERVRFRYKLEGSDKDWQDGGASRETFYTNLGPGRYTFRVIASNNDGVWNKEGAAIDFTISPAFYQTGWFYALCGLLCLLVLAILYQLRMRQLGAQIRARLEERLAERERIARELHDTLLQGVQGLIWRFQTATDCIPPGQKARQLLEQSIERADRLLAESRDRVKDLRAPLTTAVELSKALAAEGEHLALAGEAQFTATVQGELRGLHPIVREEAFLIAREALTNAFRHSGARHIEVEVYYGERALQVRVRDDGRGMPPGDPASAPDSTHFGLLGMRERAKRIRAKLMIWSKPDAGAEIDLEVPADLAYPKTQRSRWPALKHKSPRASDPRHQHE